MAVPFEVSAISRSLFSLCDLLLGSFVSAGTNASFKKQSSGCSDSAGHRRVSLLGRCGLKLS